MTRAVIAGMLMAAAVSSGIDIHIPVIGADLHAESWHAYAAVGMIVGIESMGIPLPGETTLFIASFAAHDGKLTIEWVIVAAALGAIIGDNIGYWIGREGGRQLLEREGPFHRRRLALLAHGDRFFDEHGPKAVFLGRWVALLRVTAAVLAGANRMPWRSFFLWNALGGLAWATSIGLAGFYIGHAAEQVIQKVGIGALIALVLAAGAGLVYLWVRERRTLRSEMEAVDAKREAGHSAGAASGSGPGGDA